MLTGNVQVDPRGSQDVIGAVATIRPPPFTPQDPELWFAIIDSMLANSRIVNVNDKFNFVISHVGPSALLAVRDIIRVQPEADKYKTIKQTLIERLSDSNSKKILQLLEDQSMGSRTPSAYYRHLRSLAPSNDISDEVLKGIWERRLPSSIRPALAVATGSLAEIAKLADKIFDLFPSQNSEVGAINSLTTSSTSKHNQISESCGELAQLKQKVRELESR